MHRNGGPSAVRLAPQYRLVSVNRDKTQRIIRGDQKI